MSKQYGRAGNPDDGESGNYVLRALQVLAGYGDAEAVVQADSRLTYTEVVDTTLALATALHDKGVRAGDGVAMLVRNSPESASMQLALHLLGCRTLWIAHYEPLRLQAEFFEFAKASVLIYTAGLPRREEMATELARRDPSRLVLALGQGDGPGEDLLADLPVQAPLDGSIVGPVPESLFYSGGTTGRSKLVRHGQRFYEMLMAIAEYYRSIGEPSMRFLTTSAFTHTSGQMPAFLTLFEGGTLFQHTGGWDPAGFLATIEREQITSTFLTPALLYMVLDDPAIHKADTSTLRYLNVGGAAASPARLTQAIKELGPIIRIVYGSSEAPLITDYPFLDHDPEFPGRLGSCGRPFLDTRIEVRGEDGVVLPVGEAGEVWVTGSLLMSGYWQRPELTAETMVGGWVRTGDVGYLDEDGYLYLVDRVSDMIISHGAAINLYARPIEDVLASHPEVTAAAVIGVPDEAYGEAVRAYVVTVPGASVTADDLRDLVTAELEEPYAPRDVEFIDALPMTPLFKVDKKALRERAAG